MRAEKNVLCFVMISLALISAGGKQSENQGTAQSQNFMKPNPAGTLGVDIVISATPDFIRNWTQTPSTDSPYIKGIRKVVANQTFHAAFLITGFTGDANGDYRVSVGWKLIKPDGSVMFGQEDYAKGQGEMPPKPVFVMADPALDLVLEPADPLGAYRLEATAIDQVSGSQTSNAYQFKFVDMNIPEPNSWSFPEIIESARAITPTNLEGRKFDQFGMAYSSAELKRLRMPEMSAEKLQFYADIVTHAYPDAVFQQMPKSCNDIRLDDLNETAIANIAYISINAVEEETRKQAAACLLEVQNQLK